MKCLIPSYHRVDRCRTVDYLSRIGVKREEIFIATQTKEDYEAYKAKHSHKAQVLFREAHNCAGNRNTLLGVLEDGEIALFLDDDLRSVQRYVMPTAGEKFGHLEDMDKSAFDGMCEEAKHFILKDGAYLVGTAWNTNTVNIFRALSQGKRLSWNKTLSGATMFVVNRPGLLFDETLDCLDDTDLCLKYIQSGKDILRVTDWVMNKPQDTTEVGGCFDVYQSGKKIAVLKELDRRYYPLAKHEKDWTGMRVRSGLQ